MTVRLACARSAAWRLGIALALAAACASCRQPDDASLTGETQSNPAPRTAAASDAPKPSAAHPADSYAAPDQTSPPTPIQPYFTNIAPQAGLTATLYCGGPRKDHILESVGSGAAWIDFDEDGRLDLYLVNAWALDEEPSQVRERGRNVLYRNLGDGKFEDVAAQASVDDDSWGCGVCAGDYDNDGHVDLYVTNFGPNRLYRNRGNGTFEEVGQAAGVADDGWGAGAAFFDADLDGDLDLYVVNYIDCTWESVLAAQRTHVWQRTVKVMRGPFGMRGGRDRFYRNNGQGAFEDATEEVGMSDVAESYGLGVIASDLDHDGDVDVYVANDSNPNFLYRNNGDGRFTDIGSWSGCAVNSEGAAQGSMGVEAGDLDGDGVEEILVTNFARDYTTLYHNHGGLLFEDISVRQRLNDFTFMPMGWGCAFADYDLDADSDLVLVNGHIYPQVDEAPQLKESYHQAPLLLENQKGRLENVSQSAFDAALRVSGRGLAAADYDDDGDLDFAVTAIDSPVLLLRNDAPRRGSWVKLRLLNAQGSPAINARVQIAAGGVTQTREQRSGSTYQSQNALELHFGLGDADTIDTITIHWPGGATSQHHNLPANRTHTFQP